MFKIKQTELGEITVGREVIETIAGLAAIDCYGLVNGGPGYTIWILEHLE